MPQEAGKQAGVYRSYYLAPGPHHGGFCYCVIKEKNISNEPMDYTASSPTKGEEYCQ
jgi:hypothetical protein